MEAWPAAQVPPPRRHHSSFTRRALRRAVLAKDRAGPTRTGEGGSCVDYRRHAGADSMADLRRRSRGYRLPPAEVPRGLPAMPGRPISGVLRVARARATRLVARAR